MTNTTDYSGYLEDMHAAKKKAAMAELTSAYNKNVAALDTAEKKISPVYQAARNQTAGESERSGRNFAEYAAGTGLTTGAGGQARLARTVALQNGLNDLNAREADARADLVLQRSQAENDYRTALAKAQAEGNYELADALYQEAVRRDDTGYQRAYQQQMLDYQKQRDTVADQQWQSKMDYQKLRDAEADAQWQNQFDYQKSRDAVADAQWQRKFDYQKDLNAAKEAAEKPALTFSQMQELMKAGTLTPSVLEAYQYYMGEPYETAPAPRDRMIGGMTLEDYDAAGGNYKEVDSHLGDMKAAGKSAAEILAALTDARESGVLNQSDYMRLYSKYRG